MRERNHVWLKGRTRGSPEKSERKLARMTANERERPSKGGHEDDRRPTTDNDALISAIHVIGEQTHAARGLGNELERREKRTLLWR